MSIVMIPEVPAAKNTGVSFCKSAVKYAHYLQAAATKSTLQGSVSLYVGGTPPGGTGNQEHILFVGECQSSSCNLKHIKGDCLSVCQLEHHLEVHAIKNTL